MPDPLLILFASQTGNAGKTLLALSTAVELARVGQRAVLIDADREHRALGWSAHTWAETRRALQPHRDGIESLPATSGDHAARLIEDNRDADFILIDCPSRAGLTTLMLATVADLTVLPIPTGPKDFPLSRNTVKAMLDGIRAAPGNGLAEDIPPLPPEHLAIVPTRCHTPAEAAAARAWLESSCPDGGRLCIHPPLMEQAAYATALARGLALTETPTGRLGARARVVIASLIGQAQRMRPVALRRLESAA